MKITKKFLNEHNACSSGMNWVTENKLIGLEHENFIQKLMESDKFIWANWLIVRLMEKTERVQYAIFAAENVLRIFEKKYTNDDRPRKAIEAAKNYLNNQSEENKMAADAADAAAAAAAYAVADAAADAAAYAAADAADAAAYAVAAAAYAAAAAAAAAADAAAAAAAYAVAAAAAAAAQLKKTIINFGLILIKNI